MHTWMSSSIANQRAVPVEQGWV